MDESNVSVESEGQVMTHETLGTRPLFGRPLLLVALLGLLLLGAAAAGVVLFWTGSGDSSSAVASPSPIAEPAEPFGTIIFQGVVDRLGLPQLRTVSVPDGEPKSLRGRRFHGVEPTFSGDGRFVAFGQWITRDDDRGGRTVTPSWSRAATAARRGSSSRAGRKSSCSTTRRNGPTTALASPS